MDSPFGNDMFTLVYKAFKNLYPDKDCDCQWVTELEPAEDGHEVYGVTTFSDDFVLVEVSAQLTVVDAVEILAHELAHVVVGSDAGHGPEWEAAFDAIFDEYNRIGFEEFPVHDPVEVISGKDYVRQNEAGDDKCTS